jgi:flagellar biosynthesis chaperone FliJ
MAKKIRYPLEQVLEVKRKRVEDAEKRVQEKRRELESEKQKLVEVEKERDKVRGHHQEKLAQLREALDTGTTSPEVQQMKRYLEVVKEQLVEEEKKVATQKEAVVAAEKALEQAREERKRRQIEVDKLETHREEWEREAHKELQAELQREQDELGSIIHQSRRREKR